MFIEVNSIDRLSKIIDEQGFFSYTAERICKEIEMARKSYTYLIQHRDLLESVNTPGKLVVKFYLFQKRKLRSSMPYDAMCDHCFDSLNVLEIFHGDRILELLKNYGGRDCKFNDEILKQEIQKFITVQLDPRGLILYMDIIQGRSNRNISQKK
ncbi:MAG: hypothetical protein KHZ73_07000 [Lachnospiraceae bacterium]|nr:hypothetical protein [Lachnospiraceae bacterium]